MAGYALSRYEKSPSFYVDGNVMTLENDAAITPKNDDTKILVKQEEEGRPDMVSYRVYGNPFYAWVIMQRNGVLDPFTIKPGKYLYIPDLNGLKKDGTLV